MTIDELIHDALTDDPAWREPDLAIAWSTLDERLDRRRGRRASASLVAAAAVVVIVAGVVVAVRGGGTKVTSNADEPTTQVRPPSTFLTSQVASPDGSEVKQIRLGSTGAEIEASGPALNLVKGTMVTWLIDHDEDSGLTLANVATQIPGTDPDPGGLGLCLIWPARHDGTAPRPVMLSDFSTGAISPDGSQIAFLPNRPDEIEFRHVADPTHTARTLTGLGTAWYIHALAWGPDGLFALRNQPTPSQTTVQLGVTPPGPSNVQLVRIDPANGNLTVLAIAPPGTTWTIPRNANGRVYLAEGATSPAKVVAFDLRGRRVATYETADEAVSLDIDHTGRWLLTAGRFGRVQIRDLVTGSTHTETAPGISPYVLW
jgi:hypothetical protein